jgi:superfamily I DNA/RNA helicase
MELEPNGIGSIRIRTILEFALEARIGFLEAIEHFRSNPDDFESTGVGGLLDCVDFILSSAEQLQHLAGEDLGAWVDRVAYRLELDEDAVELIAAAAEEVRLSLEDVPGGVENAPLNYVQELSAALAGVEDDKPASMEGHVTVTSMHGAKGLSADVVFVLQAEDEVIPNGTAGAEFRESRRLLYVSVTRARRRLYIGFCSRRADGQEWVRDRRHWDRTLTRFLKGYGLEVTTVDAIIDG